MRNYLALLFFVTLSGCIGTDILDDFVDSEIVITNPLESIEVGSMYSFMAVYRNNVGGEENVPLSWLSADENIIGVDNQGVATAFSTGVTEITVTGGGATTRFMIEAGESTVEKPSERNALLATVSSYPLSGTATLSEIEGGLLLSLSEDFSTTSALPGLYLYLSNNPENLVNAYEVGRVTNFSGSQQYEIPREVGLFDFKYVIFFCKPFAVPVGNGELTP